MDLDDKANWPTTFLSADELREALPSGDWNEKFDRPYRRITEQILPMFPSSVVGGARVEAAESSARLLYLPPEAYGS